MALLEKFGWNKVIIIVGRRNEWIQIKDAIKVRCALIVIHFDRRIYLNDLFRELLYVRRIPQEIKILT